MRMAAAHPAHPAEHLLCEFSPKVSAHIGEFLQIFCKISATFAGAVTADTIFGFYFANIYAKFPQFLEVEFAVHCGGHCAAECVVVLSCSVRIEWLHCLPT